MKKVFKLLMNKAVMAGLAVLIQIVWLYMLFWHVGLLSTYTNIVVRILGIILALHLINKKMDPAFKLAWIFLLALSPLLGLLLYGIFGRSELTKRTRMKMNRVHMELAPLLTSDEAYEQELEKLDYSIAQQSYYISKWAGFPVYKHTDTKYYKCGEEMFPAMLREIEKAEKFIFLEYYIIKESYMYDELMRLLIEKAQAGVEVRLIYDDFGCVTMPSHFYRELQSHGIKCAAFNPVRPLMSIIMNNRDHRKILVVDGKAAFTGGINIADEYINRVVHFGYWKDTGIRIRGEGVWNFTCMFLEMWNYIVRSSEDYVRFRADFTEEEMRVLENPENGFVQPYGDTPLDHEKTGENVYMNIISNAKRYVYLFTPYLIVDHAMLMTLCNAAKRGVDVRIVTPGIPDKKLVYLLTQADYEQLIENGVRIYQYTPGFIHAKSFVCDDEVATVGTINMDYRSLYLHFECGVYCYRTQAVMQLKEDTMDVINSSEEITLEWCRHRNVIIRFIQAVLRLLAPLL